MCYKINQVFFIFQQWELLGNIKTCKPQNLSGPTRDNLVHSLLAKLSLDNQLCMIPYPTKAEHFSDPSRLAEPDMAVTSFKNDSLPNNS